MDHRGPEHHFDEMEDPAGGYFWQQGEQAPSDVEKTDPHADYDLNSPTGGRPYMGQPSPIRSEMTERNTPLNGDEKDRGGNPLMEDSTTSKLHRFEEEDEDEQTPLPDDAKGLGELDPIQDNQWKPGDRIDRGQGRDEMLSSVKLALEDDDALWDEVVKDFEGAEPEDDSKKVAVASWLDNQDLPMPVQHLGWDIVDVVEPENEVVEAQHKFAMPFPKGITDNLHQALVDLNVWVENPEENGKLRPYSKYWSVIRPKIREGSVQIGVEDPHMADIVNHVARTDDLSALGEE